MGKNLKGWREESNYYSQQASGANRTLALGGLAIVWLFKQDTGPILPPDLIWPIFFLTMALAFDLSHYAVGAFIWHRFFIHHENKTPKEEQNDIDAPTWKRDFVSSFFYTKIALTIIAYILLIRFLITKFI